MSHSSGMESPVPVGREQLVERLDLGCLHLRIRGDFASRAPELVDDLVLEDADDPGLQLRLRGERARSLERGDESLGHRVLGPRLVAQLQAGNGEETGPQGGQPLLELGRLHRPAYFFLALRRRRIRDDVSQRLPPSACTSA